MEELIRQAFLYVEVLDQHVAEGHYNLFGPSEEIILPRVWETTIEPGWSISMRMWPMPEPPQPGPGFPPGPPPGRTFFPDKASAFNHLQMDEEHANDLTYDTASGSKRIPRWLPDTFMSDANSISDEPEEIKGRRARVRTRITYDDSLTEEQWIDDAEDTPEDAAARKQARIERRKQNSHMRPSQISTSAGNYSPGSNALYSLYSSRESTEEPAGERAASSMDPTEALLASGRIVNLFPKWTDERFPLYVYHPSRNFVPAKLRSFLEFVATIPGI